jgi:hypothetical protein
LEQTKDKKQIKGRKTEKQKAKQTTDEKMHFKGGDRPIAFIV